MNLIKGNGVKMGRIVKKVKLGNREVKALFDTGAERSYIRKDVIPEGTSCNRIKSFRTGLDGELREIDEACVVEPEIEGDSFDVKTHPLERIGEIEGEEVDMLIGTTPMEEWDIKLNPSEKELDLTGLKRREFTEF